MNVDAEVFHIRLSEGEPGFWHPASASKQYTPDYRKDIQPVLPSPLVVLPLIEDVDELSEARRVRDRLRAEQDLADAV